PADEGGDELGHDSVGHEEGADRDHGGHGGFEDDDDQDVAGDAEEETPDQAPSRQNQELQDEPPGEDPERFRGSEAELESDREHRERDERSRGGAEEWVDGGGKRKRQNSDQE